MRGINSARGLILASYPGRLGTRLTLSLSRVELEWYIMQIDVAFSSGLGQTYKFIQIELSLLPRAQRHLLRAI